MKLKHSSLQILCSHGNKTGGEDSKGFSQLAHFPNFLEYIKLPFLIEHVFTSKLFRTRENAYEQHFPADQQCIG